MPANNKEEAYIHRVFDIGIILKAVQSALELIGGFFLLFISQQFIVDLVLSYTQGELSEDPKDIVANYLAHAAQGFSINSQHFIALYLLIHGAIKGFLAISLLMEKLWAYPTAIVIFTLFGFFQIFEFIRTGSFWILLLTLLDATIVVLAWHEYRYIKKTGIKPAWDMKTEV